jgi:SAM-dependent methyltransferase
LSFRSKVLEILLGRRKTDSHTEPLWSRSEIEIAMGDSHEDVMQAWAESARYWEKHYQTIRSMFAPVTDALVEAARISPGQRVLDVGGGAGEPSLTLAELVGLAGHVAYSDPVASMVDIAQRQAQNRGLTNISFHCAAAESLPFPDNTFDSVTCRFGAMFFTHPERGCSEVLRVVKPGGVVAFAVWRHRELNPFFAIVADIVAKYIEQVPEDPDAPGAFRYANPGSLPKVLIAAGASAVSERILEWSIQAPIALNEFWTTRVEISDSLRNKVARLTRDQLEQAREEATAAAAVYFRSGTLDIPAQALIIQASHES